MTSAASKLRGVIFPALEPPELEAQFRESGFDRDKGVAKALLLLAILFHLVSFTTDSRLLGPEDGLFLVSGIRGFSAAIALVTLLLVRRQPTLRLFDNLVFLWAFMLVLGIAWANALFPADYTAHAAWDVLLVLAVYTAVPLPLGRQFAVALVLTLGDVVLFTRFKTLARPVEAHDLLTAFICANLIGIFASWEMQRWRRSQFQLAKKEADARAELDRTLHEMKTLKGIIPICSVCKQIRSEEGDWEQIEVYIRHHSDADFSHGICPLCEKTLYGDLDDP